MKLMMDDTGLGSRRVLRLDRDRLEMLVFNEPIMLLEAGIDVGLRTAMLFEDGGRFDGFCRDTSNNVPLDVSNKNTHKW